MHILNSQMTPSYLFQIMKQTTITVIIDDINKKAQDLWEEVVVISHMALDLIM